MKNKMTLVNPFDFVKCDDFDLKVKKYMDEYGAGTEETRYEGVYFGILYYGTDIKDEYLAIDLPVMIKSDNPINEERNPVVAIVGEAPSRKDVSIGPDISVGITFGQHLESFEIEPRAYDLLIDWYLERGFDVYITNLSKWIKYTCQKKEEHMWEIVSQEIERDNEKIINCLREEFRYCRPSHIIWLGDSQWKKFVYGESSKDFFTDYTIFPHPSGSNNKAWNDRLKGKPCTRENKVEYMVTHANVLYVAKNGKLTSTLYVE